MARFFRYVGVAFLAGTVWLYLADSVGWLESGGVDRLASRLAVAGLVCLSLGFLTALLGSAGRRLQRGRCIRCGSTIEWGQTFCRDHLRTAVGEYREQTRGADRRPGRD